MTDNLSNLSIQSNLIINCIICLSSDSLAHCKKKQLNQSKCVLLDPLELILEDIFLSDKGFHLSDVFSKSSSKCRCTDTKHTLLGCWQRKRTLL